MTTKNSFTSFYLKTKNSIRTMYFFLRWGTIFLSVMASFFLLYVVFDYYIIRHKGGFLEYLLMSFIIIFSCITLIIILYFDKFIFSKSNFKSTLIKYKLIYFILFLYYTIAFIPAGVFIVVFMIYYFPCIIIVTHLYNIILNDIYLISFTKKNIIFISILFVSVLCAFFVKFDKYSICTFDYITCFYENYTEWFLSSIIYFFIPIYLFIYLDEYVTPSRRRITMKNQITKH